MYLQPDTSSRILTNLPAGALVTVLERTGGFLRILTADDRFGYVLDSTPMTRVEGQIVDSWNVLMPEVEPLSIPMTGHIPAPIELVHQAAPDVTGLKGSRKRDALVFLSQLNDKAEESDEPQGDSALFAGIAAATVGMLGLLLAHALFHLTNNELMIFFFGDVLFPLAVLTGRPNPQPAAFGLVTLLYYVALFGYGGLGP